MRTYLYIKLKSKKRQRKRLNVYCLLVVSFVFQELYKNSIHIASSIIKVSHILDTTTEYVQSNIARDLRLSDIEKTLCMLMPIGGYENAPLVPLETAVEPLVTLLPTVQTHAYVAKERCKKPADGLTPDESASIMLYTMGWEPFETSLYVVLNTTLRSSDRQKLKPWFLYLKLLLTALSRLPSQHRFIYRGIKVDLSNQYRKGETVVWWGFSSCCKSIDILQTELFLGKTGIRTIFTIECDSGKDISHHSYYPVEEEVLLLAATQFKIEGFLDQGNGLHIIQLKEIRPPFPLLRSVPTREIHHNRQHATQDYSVSTAPLGLLRDL
jgi:hypothetical protein